MSGPGTPFLRTLCNLRWLATAGQAATIIVATYVLELDLPQLPLWAGVFALALFNLSVQLRLPAADPAQVTAFGHFLVDVTVLTWMVGWAGGITNPFGSLFLVLIALAALGLSPRWTCGVAVACVMGYGISAAFGLPLHGGRFDPMRVLLWGAAASFLISAGVVLWFATRLVTALRERERELASLRERFVRNEGIVALATHAASVAHELNTPLATMTLITDEIAELSAGNQEVQDDVDTLRQLLVLCRERVLALAAPAERRKQRERVPLREILEKWRLVRPTIDLQLNANAPLALSVDPGIGHLLQVLLNNAADAGEQCDNPRIELGLRLEDGQLVCEVRDHGPGFDAKQQGLPRALFSSGKTQSMGVGLALSHATLERLGGELWTRPAPGQGAIVAFRLPLPAPEFPT